jgi:hypothetical protein
MDDEGERELFSYGKNMYLLLRVCIFHSIHRKQLININRISVYSWRDNLECG